VQIEAWAWRTPEAGPALETLELDAPREDEVLVRIVAAGICHTDLIGSALTPLPAVFGHEGAGVLEGSSVPDHFIPRLIQLHQQGRLPYDRFCRRYAFSEMPRALDDVAAGRAIKAIIC
jgi:Zn-dependent alcohol dehydrogenase